MLSRRYFLLLTSRYSLRVIRLCLRTAATARASEPQQVRSVDVDGVDILRILAYDLLYLLCTQVLGRSGIEYVLHSLFSFTTVRRTSYCFVCSFLGGINFGTRTRNRGRVGAATNVGALAQTREKQTFKTKPKLCWFPHTVAIPANAVSYCRKWARRWGWEGSSDDVSFVFVSRFCKFIGPVTEGAGWMCGGGGR